MPKMGGALVSKAPIAIKMIPIQPLPAWLDTVPRPFKVCAGGSVCAARAGHQPPTTEAATPRPWPWRCHWRRRYHVVACSSQFSATSPWPGPGRCAHPGDHPGRRRHRGGVFRRQVRGIDTQVGQHTVEDLAIGQRHDLVIVAHQDQRRFLHEWQRGRAGPADRLAQRPVLPAPPRADGHSKSSSPAALHILLRTIRVCVSMTIIVTQRRHGHSRPHPPCFRS